jgi:hypothetical protein
VLEESQPKERESTTKVTVGSLPKFSLGSHLVIGAFAS